MIFYNMFFIFDPTLNKLNIIENMVLEKQNHDISYRSIISPKIAN